MSKIIEDEIFKKPAGSILTINIIVENYKSFKNITHITDENFFEIIDLCILHNIHIAALQDTQHNNMKEYAKSHKFKESYQYLLKQYLFLNTDINHITSLTHNKKPLAELSDQELENQASMIFCFKDCHQQLPELIITLYEKKSIKYIEFADYLISIASKIKITKEDICIAAIKKSYNNLSMIASFLQDEVPSYVYDNRKLVIHLLSYNLDVDYIDKNSNQSLLKIMSQNKCFKEIYAREVSKLSGLNASIISSEEPKVLVTSSFTLEENYLGK